jgi:hypothetical protein
LNPACDFWRNVVRSYIEGNELPELSTCVDGSCLEAGEATHTLEFLDCLNPGGGDRSDRVLARSRERRAGNVIFNRFLLDELEEIDSKVRQQSVPYAWLKGGVFLRDEIYPKGVRRLSDLDLLLRKQDLTLWHEIFEDLGYRTHRDPQWIQSPGFSESVSSTFYTKQRAGKTILIDVHWHLVDYPARRSTGRWNYDMAPVFESLKDQSLAPEHRVLYLVDHAFSHEFRFWKFLTDLHHVLAAHPLDRNFLRNEASRMNYGDSLKLGLSFVEEFWNGQVPAHIRGPLEDFFPEENESPGAFVKKALNRNLPESSFLRQCYTWLNSYQQKGTFLWRILFPPVSAVPRISSDSGLAETIRLYGGRMGRVLGRAPFIWDTSLQE